MCVCAWLLTSHSVSYSTNMFVYWVYWQWSHRTRQKLRGGLGGWLVGRLVAFLRENRKTHTNKEVLDEIAFQTRRACTQCTTVRLYLFDGSLANLVRVFPDALQEVPQLRHGRVPDLRPQLGDVFSHDGAEPVLARLWETRMLQLFQRPQGRVVPNTHASARVKFISRPIKQPVGLKTSSLFLMFRWQRWKAVWTSVLGYGWEHLQNWKTPEKQTVSSLAGSRLEANRSTQK